MASLQGYALLCELTTKGAVRVGWHRDGIMIEIWIKDDGPGLAGTANLFVPLLHRQARRLGDRLWC